MMKLDVSKAAKMLRGIAAGCPEQEGKPAVLTVPYRLGATRLTFKVPAHPELIRLRADRLERDARAWERRLNSLHTPTGSLRAPKQARYSEAVAKRFLDDGEIDNYNNYRELYHV
jgi:hypothetical protein